MSYRRRARPLLGTIVEISILECSHFDAVIDEAFKVVERVHALMSPYEVTSDICKINKLAHIEPVQVDAWTYEVLHVAGQFYDLSEGVFNVACNRDLRDYMNDRRNPLVLLPDNMVALNYPSYVDLGGIAKGFAVDKAVEQLVSLNVKSGVVNAGGDLRCFGQYHHPLSLRDPSALSKYFQFLTLIDMASATSTPRLPRDKECRLFNGRTGKDVKEDLSVTVVSKTCMIADALTKIAVHDSQLLSKILEYFSSEAFLIKKGEVFYFESENEKNRIAA